MLNTLVNSTDKGLCNQTSAYYEQSCIDEIFERIGTVACQTDMNTEALEQIHDNLQTTNVSATNVSAVSVCTNSVCTNAISTVGIEANNVQSQCLNVDGKATVGSLESCGTVKAESVETQSLSTENITGLQSLTVDGCVWADAVDTDALKVNGKAVAECIESDEISTESLKSDTISTSTIGADTVVSDCFMGTNANIQKACVGSLSTSCFSSDEIATSKINSTSLSVPKVETSGGITGKGTIDVTSPVWKEIKIPLFTGTVQFYTDEWKVTINGGREFIWEDPSLDHLKFLSNDGETVTVAVDWDGEVFYTYNVVKEEPVLSFTDNTGHTPDDDHTYIMQDSGIPRGTVYIYRDKEFTNQGLTILGNVKASNLEITCGESMDCLSIENLCVGNSIISGRPIKVDICARNFCVSSPCTYIDNCLYADHLEANCICANGHLWADNLYFDMIQVVHCVEKPKSVVVYENGLLCDSYKVCVDDDTVYSQKSCACDFYGNLHGKANDTCCFDGRTFAKACNEILSGKACTAELADMAKKVCIGYYWATDITKYGYIPFVDPYSGCIFQAKKNDGYSNPFVGYNDCGLVSLAIDGCVCVRGKPLIANCSISACCLKADDMTVRNDALITKLCSCNSYTERLCVNQRAKFQGPVYFYDNIYQCGQAYCTHAQNIYTCSDTITMREGADFAGDAQIKVLKYDGTNNGIIQLGTDGTLRIGDETNCQPVLTRSEEDDICDGHVLVWDATNRCAKDGGDAIVTCEYVHCVGKECKNAACEYGCIVGTQCKTTACNYATSVGTQCKTAACKFVVSCGHEIGTSCKGAACGYATSVGGQCKAAACGYALGIARICKLDAEVASCNYAVSVGGKCRDAACSFTVHCGNIAEACACSFTVSCGQAIGTACKGAACDYASSVGTQCKSAACTYASSVGGQCKSAACTYANTVAFCNVNTCKGLGVMGVARGIDAQCWTKAGYWTYMTTKDGPNCCWNHVIKTDWSAGVDPWNSGISIPTYNAPQNGIHYKTGCCGGTTGWTLVPDITCVQNTGLACRSIAEACACAFAATCAQSVVPETSTFAKCYGNSTNCVAYANQVRVGVSSENAFYKMPFTGSTGTTTSNQSLYIDNANAYPSYNPSTNVFCGYTVCVAQTLAVRNANGGFRLGNYCIYIA